MRNHQATVLNIGTSTREYFGKLLSLNTVCRCIKKSNLNLCYARRNIYISSIQRCRQVLWARAHLRWSKRQWKCVPWSDESTFQHVFGKNGHRVLSPKDDRGQPDFHQRQVQKQTFVTWVTRICVKVPLTWRRILGLYRDIYCHQDNIFPGKQDNAGLILHMLS